MEICSTWPAYTPDTAYEADASVIGLLVLANAGASERAPAIEGESHGWA
ncbi:MAG TPA: hypothetical protein VF228_16000 [Iamia sp.]